MKNYMIAVVALVLPLVTNAATELEASSGLYTECVKWTTVNGVEHSKEFRYALNEDDSMSLDILFYTGTATCEGDGEVLLHAERFTILEKIVHKKTIFMLTARNEDSGDYYEMMFSKDSVMVQISDSLPIKYDFNRTLLLKKAQ